MANSPSGESVLERSLRILEAFDARHSRLTVSVIAQRATLPLATAHRLIEEMVRLGALERVEDRRLQLGRRLWELSYRGSDLQRLREAALPSMLDVQEIVRQHTNLAVRDSDHVLYVERLSAPQSTLSIAGTATRLPLHLTSSGLILMAFGDEGVFEGPVSSDGIAPAGEAASGGMPPQQRFEEIRRQGYCIAPGYTVPTSTGVAVPIYGARRMVVAALSVIVPRDEVTAHAAVPVLTVAARAISRTLERSLNLHVIGIRTRDR